MLEKKTIYYAKQNINSQDVQCVSRVLKSDFLTQGPAVKKFEDAVAAFCGAKYAVAVNSGTSALHIACLASGLKDNDEAITSAITFVASSNSILYCRANPVFADISGDGTVCIDPREMLRNITPRTKVIIPVHFAGHPCENDKIYESARKKNISIIEDASHALGATYKGSRIGDCRYSDMTVFSFHAVKNMTTGEGGMVVTNNKNLYQKLLLFRSHGITRDQALLKKNYGPWHYEMQALGFNYRLTDIQSALGLSQLKRLTEFIKKRQEITYRYDRAFSRFEEIKTLVEKPYAGSSHHLYIIRLDSDKIRIPKKTVFKEYQKRGIIVNVHYMPVYQHPYYQNLGYKIGICPNAERYFNEAITLPLYPTMSREDISRVIKTTGNIITKYSRHNA